MSKDSKDLPRDIGVLSWLPTAVITIGIITLIASIPLGERTFPHTINDYTITLSIASEFPQNPALEIEVAHSTNSTGAANKTQPFIVFVGVLLCAVGLFLYRERRRNQINVDEFNQYLERVKSPCRESCQKIIDYLWLLAKHMTVQSSEEGKEKALAGEQDDV